jgi:hypothetical protein
MLAARPVASASASAPPLSTTQTPSHLQRREGLKVCVCVAAGVELVRRQQRAPQLAARVVLLGHHVLERYGVVDKLMNDDGHLQVRVATLLLLCV